MVTYFTLLQIFKCVHRYYLIKLTFHLLSVLSPGIRIQIFTLIPRLQISQSICCYPHGKSLLYNYDVILHAVVLIQIFSFLSACRYWNLPSINVYPSINMGNYTLHTNSNSHSSKILADILNSATYRDNSIHYYHHEYLNLKNFFKSYTILQLFKPISHYPNDRSVPDKYHAMFNPINPIQSFT